MTPRMATTYIKPGDVLSPKRYWQLFHVLFDGGAVRGEDSDDSRVSLAVGRWERRPVLAMRWNGTTTNPLGHPQSRGLPTWFIVPDQYVWPILETFDLSHPKLQFVRNFLERRRLYFWTRCTTRGCKNFGELILVGYRSEELQDILELVDRDELKFYCVFCDDGPRPTPDEKVRLTKELKQWLGGG